MGVLIDNSLTEVRLRLSPELHVETSNLLLVVNQILVTAQIEAQFRGQTIEIQIEPSLVVQADQQAFYSALSNIIQNALKFTPPGGRIQVRGRGDEKQVVVEVEDECGGLKPGITKTLFTAFEQHNEDRTGLGLGLTIARRAIELNHGTLEVRSVDGRGCIFKITLPKAQVQSQQGAAVG